MTKRNESKKIGMKSQISSKIFRTILKKGDTIRTDSITMTNTKKSRKIRKKGQEESDPSKSMTENHELLQQNFVVYNFEDKYLQGGISL